MNLFCIALLGLANAGFAYKAWANDQPGWLIFHITIMAVMGGLVVLEQLDDR